jgi:hypothetical protein
LKGNISKNSLWEGQFQNRLYGPGTRRSGRKVVERKPPTIVCEHKVAEIKNVNFSAREEHGRVSEEIDAVEPDSESTRSCGIEAFVTTGDVADSREVVLILCLDLRADSKLRVVADEESRLQERSVLAAT